MVINDYLADISEKQMAMFLQSRFGSCLEGVVKYYDDSYGGYLFKAKLNGGIDYLPKERDNTLRIGKFGLVKDDKSFAIPRIIENFDIAKTAPNFFKNYVKFIAENVGERRVNNKTYLERLNIEYSSYLMFEKINKVRELEEEIDNQKKMLKNIISEVQNKVEKSDD